MVAQEASNEHDEEDVLIDKKSSRKLALRIQIVITVFFLLTIVIGEFSSVWELLGAATIGNLIGYYYCRLTNGFDGLRAIFNNWR